MRLRLGALHDALLNPGDAELAKKAAEELANYDTQLAELRSDTKLIKWILTFHTAMLLAILWRVFA